MSGDVLLVGPLAQTAVMQALGLGGKAETIQGRLSGGPRAGIDAEHWPHYQGAPGRIAAVRVARNDALDRYAAVMGLEPLAHGGRSLLGVGRGPASEDEWRPNPARAALVAEIARLVLQSPQGIESGRLRARLPMIAIWAESRIRARSGPVSGADVVARRGPGDLRLSDHRQPYAGYFAVETMTVSHRRHDGGFTRNASREGFIMGDAVVVLPWDPVRDRVLAIEQFRVAPALRQDPQPWLLEAVAGRVDAGESPEDAARRETLEEADLRLIRLVPAIHHYPSPGAVTEFLYLYLGIADLPDGTEGVHGLDGEAEDIRGHLLDRQALLRMVLSGQVSNGPLAMLALWLDARRDGLLAELSRS
ncbi:MULTISPECIES: NUDIX domain-containing protein [unclassified Paracoccus (in: a-proteobacteria)]|uniref:NUDIX domain-containing protein n=2 Tax=Paracoccus TaxID=265 RepID=UPI000C6B72E6|nr:MULTISPECIES: NUDIX domain-containing protein [unclassified Paracoccus (in: a-proteobacteria)]MBA48341.1 NUDIX hydrolase [Paracoccus sp. (in: a-proteobacteria)]MCS5602300.1 NUDIX domain-containing protein [Paracoccus sp. (in: a-proteobacteria)]MDB2552108.1 NUDIX domain-containing protein [Paracoccus sp. (in: a-proteobacteria)]